MLWISDFVAGFNPLAFFGLILILGLLGGECTRYVSWVPKIIGYMLIGLLLGPSGFDIGSQSTIFDVQIFLDISLGLILFELGRQLDFNWLKHDRALLKMSLAESSLTFIAVFGVLILLGFEILSAAFAACIMVTTSAAVLMLVAYDLSSEGPVTRRALMLTSINNLFGLTLFFLLLSFSHLYSFTGKHFLLDIFRLGGAFLLGYVMFYAAKTIGMFVQKRKEAQFILFVGMVLMTIGFARMLEVSVLLSLLTLGIATRNFDSKHRLMEISFENMAQLAFVMLFVTIGIQLDLRVLGQSTFIVFVLILVRALAKSIGIWFYTKQSQLTSLQGKALCLALTPMAGVAMGMTSILTEVNENFGQELTAIVISMVAILNLIGPLVTQVAFNITDEALSKKKEGL